MRPSGGPLAILDGSERVKKALREVTSDAILAGDVKLSAFVFETINWSYDSGRARAKHFEHTFVLDGSNKLMDGPGPLRHFELLPLTRKLENAFAGNAGEDRAIKWCRNQLQFARRRPPETKQVHSTNFRNEIVREPEDLLVTLLSGSQGRLNCGSIIRANLVATSASRPCSNMRLIREQGYRLEARREVRANR